MKIEGGGKGTITSVNGQTGPEVVLTAYDVNALPITTKIPTKLSELENDVGFVRVVYDSTEPTGPDKPEIWIDPLGDTLNIAIIDDLIPSYNTTYSSSKIEDLLEHHKSVTKVSELENDIGYITLADVPTNISAFINDSNYINQIKTINGITLIGEGNIEVKMDGGMIYQGPDEPTSLDILLWIDTNENPTDVLIADDEEY